MLDSSSILLIFPVIGLVVISLLTLFLLIGSILVVATVENESMAPALNPGDRVLILRWYPGRFLRRGHIVIIWPWDKSSTVTEPFRVEKPFIKRIIGLPGDTLITSIDELDEFNRVREGDSHDSQGQRTWYIPEGHCFVRGDHPTGGFDSLTWGPIPFQTVLGVVIRKLP